jgi:inosose dehydratase
MLRLGIAPIGWTNDDMPDLGAEISFEQCVDEMSRAGYIGTEIGNKYPKDPAILKAELRKRGMTVANRWHSSFILTNDLKEEEKSFREDCAFLKATGADRIGVSEQSYSVQGKPISVFDNKYTMTESEWKRLVSGLNHLGQIALEYGISLTYHHHMGTVVQNEYEVDKFMEMTDPRYVSLLYDTGHLAYAGADYIGVLRRYIGRIKHIHLKDIRPDVVNKVKKDKLSFLQGVRIGTFTVPGDGCLNFPEVFDIIKEARYSGWLLVEAEQDPSKANPYEYAVKAKNYMDSLLKR